MEEVILGVPEKRRQHYVPQYFLKSFSNEKKRLACIRREATGRYILSKNESLKNICVERDLYETKLNQTTSEALFPNALENNLSSAEAKQKQMLDIAKDRILQMRSDTPLSESDLDSLLNILSIILAGLVYRRPSELALLDVYVSEIMKAFRGHNLGTAEELESLFRDETDYEKPLPLRTFEPDSIAELALYRINVLPYGLDVDTFLKTGMGQLAQYLRNCSVMCLVADGTSSFVGLDYPTNHELSCGVLAHYWPIAGDIAVVFIDDGNHILRKHEVDAEELMAFNEFAILNGEWRTAFGPDPAVMEKLYLKLGESNEQDW